MTTPGSLYLAPSVDAAPYPIDPSRFGILASQAPPTKFVGAAERVYEHFGFFTKEALLHHAIFGLKAQDVALLKEAASGALKQGFDSVAPPIDAQALAASAADDWRQLGLVGHPIRLSVDPQGFAIASLPPSLSRSHPDYDLEIGLGTRDAEGLFRSSVPSGLDRPTQTRQILNHEIAHHVFNQARLDAGKRLSISADEARAILGLAPVDLGGSLPAGQERLLERTLDLVKTQVHENYADAMSLLATHGKDPQALRTAIAATSEARNAGMLRAMDVEHHTSGAAAELLRRLDAGLDPAALDGPAMHKLAGEVADAGARKAFASHLFAADGAGVARSPLGASLAPSAAGVPGLLSSSEARGMIAKHLSDADRLAIGSAYTRLPLLFGEAAPGTRLFYRDALPSFEEPRLQAAASPASGAKAVASAVHDGPSQPRPLRPGAAAPQSSAAIRGLAVGGGALAFVGAAVAGGNAAREWREGSKPIAAISALEASGQALVGASSLASLSAKSLGLAAATAKIAGPVGSALGFFGAGASYQRSREAQARGSLDEASAHKSAAAIRAAGALGSIAASVAAGAAIGTTVPIPVVGTVGGAAVGLAVGVGAGLIAEYAASKRDAQAAKSKASASATVVETPQISAKLAERRREPTPEATTTADASPRRRI